MIYRFARFTLDLSKRELLDNTIKVKLSARDFDVLLYLIQNCPKISSVNEIIENVWSGSNVENNSVEKSIANLRGVLGDNKKDAVFIKTVRSRGYLFVADVEILYLDNTPPQTTNLNEESNTPRFWHVKKTAIFKVFSLPLIAFAVLVVFWWKPIDIWAKLYSKVILYDDFSASELNRAIWETEGKTVKAEDGLVKIIISETDVETYLYSKFLVFDPEIPITVKSRIKISHSKNLKEKVYFNGFFGLTPDTPLFERVHEHNFHMFGIRYINYDYESFYSNGEMDYVKSEGFFLFKEGGAPNKKNDYRDGKIGSRIDPPWDRWFEQKIIYNPLRQELSYYIDGKLADVFPTGNLYKELRSNQIRLEICPSGWWVNHSIEMDYIEVTQ